MINALVQRVRASSLFVRFMAPIVVIVTMAVAVLDGVKAAGLVLVAGITMIMILELVTTPVTSALFLHMHGRSGVPMYCGQDERSTPTATDWHRAIIGMTFCYGLIVALFAIASVGSPSLGVILTGSAIFMCAWVLALVGVPALLDVLHFLGHRRHYRKELAAVQEERAIEQARAEAVEVDQRFWSAVRDFREPGPESVA